MADPLPPAGTAPPPSLVSYTHWMYALHTLSALMGVFTAATIIGSFIFGIPSIAAVVMNYVKRDEARGTWLEGHFSWQLRSDLLLFPTNTGFPPAPALCDVWKRILSPSWLFFYKFYYNDSIIMTGNGNVNG